MIKLDLLLCQEVLLRFLQPLDQWERNEIEARLKDVISQHRIVLSPNLTECYEKYFDSCGNGAVDLYMSFLNAEAVYEDRFRTIPDEAGELTSAMDIDSILIDLAKCALLTYPYVLCNGCDLMSSLSTRIMTKRALYLSSMRFDSIDNRLSRNSPPFSIQVQPNEQCDKYSSWFGELFRGERQIIIFDKYIICDESHLKTFEEYYLKRMKDTTLSIFTEVEDYNWFCGELKNRLCTVAARNNLIIKVYTAQRKPVHDRYIFIQNYRVSLGHGLDFLDIKTGKTKGGNSIHFEKTPSGAMPSDLCQDHSYSLLYLLNDKGAVSSKLAHTG